MKMVAVTKKKVPHLPTKEMQTSKTQAHQQELSLTVLELCGAPGCSVIANGFILTNFGNHLPLPSTNKQLSIDCTLN